MALRDVDIPNLFAVLISIAVYGGFGWLIIGQPIYNNLTSVTYKECEIQSVSPLVESSGEGTHVIEVTKGSYGKKQVCKPSKSGYSYKETILEPAVNRVERRYTPQPEPVVVPQQQYSGGGAICNDGSRSYSTGRGTCSHHGGVDYWMD